MNPLIIENVPAAFPFMKKLINYRKILYMRYTLLIKKVKECMEILNKKLK